MWKEDVIRNDSCQTSGGEAAPHGYRRVPGGWVSSDVRQLDESDQMWKGSIFHGRTADEFSTTAIETSILAGKLRSFFSRYEVSRDAIVMDAGCGDGRVTHLLLDSGMRRMISTDLHKSSIDRLLLSLNAEEQDRVLTIADDFTRIPIKDACVDMLVAIAVFGEIPDVHAALRTAVRILKPGGLMFSTDPLMGQALVYALVRHDIDEFVRIARTSTRARMWDQKHLRYRVYAPNELEARLFEHPELEIIETDGIDMLPSLVFGGLLQDKQMNDAEKQELKALILGLVENRLRIDRQAIHICRKRMDR